jgi:hypothetical protein
VGKVKGAIAGGTTMSGIKRGCWADNAFLPIPCSIDIDEHWNCIHAEHIDSHDKCAHWDADLTMHLAHELVGDGYRIVRADNEM